VIDSSITLAWYFDDEETEATRDLFDQVVEHGAVVPELWRYEVANALQMAVRRSRIDARYRDESLADLDALDIAVDPECDTYVWSATLRLAERHGLTIYDAAYLELAQRLRLTLATLDAALIRAGRAELVTVVGIAQ
jgi:predicted nucleic acid-binding protein